MSPDTNVRVTATLSKVRPEPFRVQYRLTVLAEFRPEVATFGWSPSVVEAERRPPTVTFVKATETGT